jgi:hypothetical protein
VLQVRVAGLPIIRWSRSSKHFLPHSLSFLKLPLFAASVPSFDASSQRWLWRYHTRSVQCFAAAVLASCSLAHPACFRKALRTLFVHTELTVVSPFRTSNVIYIYHLYTLDQRRDYRERGGSRAKAQHDIFIKSLKKVARDADGENEGWKIKLLMFVGGTSGSVN